MEKTKDIKKVTFMIGPSGSGKSSTARTYQEETGLDFIIDVDAFKLQLNDFKPLCKKRNAELHPKASKMAKAKLDSIRVGSGWVLYDSTGKDFKKVQQRTLDFLDSGFEVELLLVELGLINTLLNVHVRNGTSSRAMLLRVSAVIWFQCKYTQRKIKKGYLAGCKVKRVQGFKRISVTFFNSLESNK